MKKILLLPLLLLLAVACRDDDDCCLPPLIEEFELTFKTKTQAGNLILLENFSLEDGTLVNLNRLQFYISNIRLLQGSNEVAIKDVDLVSFERHTDTDKAEAGETLSISGVPEGEFSGIRFGIGVMPELNGNSPNYYANEQPESVLSAGLHHWNSWNSYVFAKIEGYFDANGNGVCGGGDSDETITYHTGIDELYREKTILAPISVNEIGGAEFSIILDVDKIFNAVETLTIADAPVAHSNPMILENMVVTTKIADNFVEALSAE